MKKEEFLIKLRAHLLENGISEEIADKETENVRVYLNESNMDEVDISVEVMAEGIISVLGDGAEAEQMTIPVAVPADPENESVSDEFSAAIAQIDGDTPAQDSDETSDLADDPVAPPVLIETESECEQAQTEPEDADAQTDHPCDDQVGIDPDLLSAFESELVAEEDAEPEQASPSDDQAPLQLEEDTTDDEDVKIFPYIESETEQQPEPQPDPAVPVQITDEDEDGAEKEEAEIEEFIPIGNKRTMKKKPNDKKAANDWIYIAILVVTIPIAIALILIAAVLYLGFWVALALAMIACIAVLIVFVTVGAIISLVGIVYGVVQLITGLVPVGLFEIGLGIVVAAAVMFIGILIYNFAVRFIPYGMKLLAKLFRAGFRAIRSGYHSLKGAVDSI